MTERSQCQTNVSSAGREVQTPPVAYPTIDLEEALEHKGSTMKLAGASGTGKTECKTADCPSRLTADYLV